MRLTADEPVEVFEPAAAGGPRVERTGRTGLPNRNFVALAELSSRISVQLQRLCKRGSRVRKHRTITRRAGGNFGDASHADRVMVAACEQRLARRRAKSRCVETIVLKTARRQAFRRRRLARTAERA